MEQILTENFQDRTEPSPQGGCSSRPLLHPRVSKSHAGKSSNHDVANVGQIHLSSYKLGDINLFHGVPFLSREGQKWIGVRSEEGEPQKDNYKFSGLPWVNQSQDSRPESLLRSTFEELPPRGVLESYLEKSQRSDFFSFLPLTEPVLFAATVERAYDASGTYQALTAKASIFAYLALRVLIGDSETENLASQPVAGYEAACRILMPDLFAAQPSSEIVGTLMMLAVYQFGCGNIHTTDIIMSLAARFLFMLGAHLYPGTDIDGPPIESQKLEARRVLYQRDLFWICYSLDKEIMFRTGRPPIINDTSCDLTFPAYYLEQMSLGPHIVWRLPSDLRLSIIKSNAYEKLYSPQSLHKSDAELFKDIRELDNTLESWGLSLPVGFRPTLSFSESMSTQLELPPWNISALMVRLEYYHCMTTIHQASSRSTNWTYKRRVNEGLLSSIELALQSSRCQLRFLHSAEPISVPNIFWYVIDSSPTSSLIHTAADLLPPHYQGGPLLSAFSGANSILPSRERPYSPNSVFGSGHTQTMLQLHRREV
ncbi:hypothetical protein EDD37DRAFT_678485 [Exophiala viscosa]|uniref:uncharacterized protein n=1 Tax=Exophiala viscosa TaxID=2486360 RepID=UPI00219235F5|nr:hypothetical protein EDD37DRAFT_678485 [Exophiala viscosa]